MHKHCLILMLFLAAQAHGALAAPLRFVPPPMPANAPAKNAAPAVLPAPSDLPPGFFPINRAQVPVQRAARATALVPLSAAIKPLANKPSSFAALPPAQKTASMPVEKAQQLLSIYPSLD